MSNRFPHGSVPESYHRNSATQAVLHRLDHGQHSVGGDGGVNGGASFGEDPGTGYGGLYMAGGNDAVARSTSMK